jgi:hypothetical protein
MTKKEAWTKERKLLDSVSKSMANAVSMKAREIFDYTDFPVNAVQNIARHRAFVDENRPQFQRFIQELVEEKFQETMDKILKLRGIHDGARVGDGDGDTGDDDADSGDGTDSADSDDGDGTDDTGGGDSTAV